MKVAAIICARMGSERFPGKVMEKIAGVPMFKHIYQRAEKLYGVDNVKVATTENKEDEVIGKAIPCLDAYASVWTQGSEKNVLDRIIQASGSYDFIYRMTGDNPVVDPDVYLSAFNPHADYTYLGGLPDGTVPEFISVEALQRLRVIVGDNPYFQEHPTQGFHKFWRYFTLSGKLCGYNIPQRFRLTVDYPEDAVMFNHMYGDIGLDAALPEIIQYLDANPQVARINAHLKSEHRIGDLSKIPPDRAG